MRNRQTGRGNIASTAMIAVAVVLMLLAGVSIFVSCQTREKGVQPFTSVPPAPTTTAVPTTTTPPVPSLAKTQPTVKTSKSSKPSKASASTSSSVRQCRAGWPKSFTWPDLGISKAPIEKIGSTGGVPDAPTDKTHIGVYQQVVNGRTWGHLPGQGLGNVIMDGHTYGDDSAVFKSNADKFVHVSSTFWFTMQNGSVCEYRVTRVWHQLSKASAQKDAAHPLFSDVAKTQGFYNLSRSTEQVFGMTCAGSYNEAGTHHLYETAWYAKPIN